MEDTRLCCSCGDEYPCRSQNPNQKFCSKKACQNERNRRWKVEKREDPNFRETEQATQKKWRGNNPDYMRDYRRNNPKYVEKNGKQQGVRNAQRTGSGSSIKEEKSGRSGQGATNSAKQKPSGMNKSERTMIVKSNASNTAAAKTCLDEILATCDTVIVKSNASSSSNPMVLVPLSMLMGIVKATRQGEYQLE